MSSFSEQARKFIEKEKLFDVKDRLVCAVSGGIDSMVMIHLLHHMGFQVTVAHVNYGLRGSESDEDQSLVAHFCKYYKIQINTKTLSKEDTEELKKGNLQEKARMIRYAWFEEIRKHTKSSFICTAHNQNDQAETFLLHALRGSGMLGLSGISPKIALIRRPLLFAHRDEISQYAKEMTVPFNEDQSNRSNKYERNFVRNVILPSIKERWPSAVSSLYRSSQNLQRDHALMEYLLDNEKEKWITTTNGKTCIGPLSDLRESPIGTTLLFHLLAPYGFSFEVTSDIIGRDSISGTIFHSSSHDALIDRDKILIRESIESDQVHQEISTVGEWTNALGNMSIQNVTSHDFNSDSKIEIVDTQKLEWPLTLRIWKHGDRMSPLGMKGKSKLVSDILTDKKINQFQKEKTLVLTSKDNVIWLVGIMLSDEFKITKGSQSLLKLEWKPM